MNLLSNSTQLHRILPDTILQPPGSDCLPQVAANAVLVPKDPFRIPLVFDPEQLFVVRSVLYLFPAPLGRVAFRDVSACIWGERF
jgi:hypothetical protein